MAVYLDHAATTPMLPEAIAAYAEAMSVVGNPSLVALTGPLFGLSLGGLTAWKIGITSFVLVALMSVFTVVRHTRAEEEAGLAELTGAGAVGRLAPRCTIVALI